jgi:hypothetical protein
MNNDLRETALQMFHDLYLHTICGKYGYYYYLKMPNSKGAYLSIQTTDKILADIPLKLLSPETILKKYKSITKTKKQSVNNDDSGDYYCNNVDDYF